jgi:HK97 family phage portal protein
MTTLGLVERAFRAVGGNPLEPGYWQGTVFGGTPNSSSGMTVTPDRALTLAAVYACMKVIGEDVSTLNFQVFRKTSSGSEPAQDHPLYDLLHDQPNDDQTAQEWREEMTVNAAARGSGYARIIPGRRGFADQLKTIPPDSIRRESLPSGDYRYIVRPPSGPEETVLKDEVFELRAFLGLSVVGLARETFGNGLAAQQHAGRSWANGAKPSGVLKHKGTLSSGAQDRLTNSFAQKYGGTYNSGKPIVLEEGMDFTPTQLSNVDMQFIEGEYFGIEEVCRWFRMQPHKIAHLLRATFSNIEEQNIEHGKDTIEPWCVRWEQSVKRQLIIGPQFFASHDREQLYRGSGLSEAQANQIYRNIGVLNSNEIRDKLNRNPRAGGDKYWDVQPGTGSGAAAPQPSKARVLAEQAARNIVARERAAVTRNAPKFASDYDAWQSWCREFFGEHAGVVAERLALSVELARAYAEEKCSELIADGLQAVERWEARDIPALAMLALGGDY